MRTLRHRSATFLFVALAVAVVLLPSNAFAAPAAPAPPPGGSGTGYSSQSPNATVVNLSVDLAHPFNLSNIFWGTTVQPRWKLYGNESYLVNSTPTQVVVWPGGNAGDDYNPITNNLTTPGGNQIHERTNEAAFVQWCESINCSAIFQVPGEVDDPALGAAVVGYTENTLHFHPRYWEIGNEPELWLHWKEPWSNWTYSNVTPPTPQQYANETLNYTQSMLAVDPTLQFIGVPATARTKHGFSLEDWVTAVIYALGPTLGPRLSAVAFHEYPGERLPHLERRSGYSLKGFYDSLNGNNSLPVRLNGLNGNTGLLAVIRNDTEHWCPVACRNLSVFVTELGAALSKTDFGIDFSPGFPGALNDAAQVTQAIDLNLTNLDIFSAVSGSTNSWFDPNLTERPVYTLYSQLLTHLGSTAYPTTVTGLNSSVYASATIAPGARGRSDLMVVNTNLTESATFTPVLPGIVGIEPVQAWQWNGTLVRNTSVQGGYNAVPATPGPVTYPIPGGTPASFTLPPQSVVVLEAYPMPAYPVRFVADGFGLQGHRWFANVNGREFETNGTSYTLLLPDGALDISSVGYDLIGWNWTSPLDRVQPFVHDAAVAGSPLTVPIDFVRQWNLARVLHVNVNLSHGTVSPIPTWWNDSEPFQLTASPAPDWLFNRWFGGGPGNATNSTDPTITVVPTGNYSLWENATFAYGYPIAFTETGLPAGAPWGAQVAGLQTTSVVAATPAARFLEANGTWGFRITAPPGYIAHPSAGALPVAGSPAVVPITFTAAASTPTEYGVQFVETGLPSGAAWTVTARGATETSASSSLLFSDPNGTFGYSVLPVTGYRAPQANGSFTVLGGPTTVTIAFEPVHAPGLDYPVVWTESGLPNGTPWSLTVRGIRISSDTSTIAYVEPNGTSAFQVAFLPGFRPHPANSSVDVNGTPVFVSVAFQPSYVHLPTIYPVVWEETGLWGNVSWAVQLAGPTFPSSTISTSHAWAVAQSGGRDGLPNGSYSFAVPNASGFVPQPAAGTLVVLGGPVTIDLSFARPAPRFPIEFIETGLSSGGAWQVRLSNGTQSSSTETASFSLPNGNYTFTVSAPTGYYPVPSHGVVTVLGARVTVSIVFQSNLPPLPPSLWVVGARAVAVMGVIGFAGGGMYSALRFLSRPRTGRGK